MKPSLLCLSLVLLATVSSFMTGQTETSSNLRIQSPPSPDAAGVYTVGNGVTEPKVIFAPEPEFSEAARKKKISGDCTVSVVVGRDGTVVATRILHSAAEGVPARLRDAARSLDQNVLEAVRKYRFQPGLLNGVPVPVATTVEVNFRVM